MRTIYVYRINNWLNRTETTTTPSKAREKMPAEIKMDRLPKSNNMPRVFLFVLESYMLCFPF